MCGDCVREFALMAYVYVVRDGPFASHALLMGKEMRWCGVEVADYYDVLVIHV